MRNIIQFTIEKEKNGLYVASGVNAPMVTDAKTFEKLQTPAIIANLEISNMVYF